ncbi:MAG: hypothetical protein HQK67_12280, partial [Desulfamplus sp.]|nr:hypothetical protein [Desulfamplus sp.]
MFCQSEAYADPPDVTIDRPTIDVFQFGSTILFSATATDPDVGDTISSYLWNSSIQGKLSSDSMFTNSTLAIGIHDITLVVTDSNGEKGYAEITITIQSTAPTISITSPANGSYYDYNSPLTTTEGDYVIFEATATDSQDDSEDIKITWRSSIDNEFGSGSSVGPVTLSAGAHSIEVTATDSDGNKATDIIIITILNQPPVAEISLPDDNDDFRFGDLITFSGTGTDPEQGKLTGDSLVWTSSQGILIGKGEVVSSRTLQSGIHIITLTVKDSSGAQDSTSITITVGNASPKAEITFPADGTAFKFKEVITFKGIGLDYEDGTLPASSLIWTSSDEFLGEGNSFSVNNLPTGTHTITLTVTDSEGITAADQIIIIVGNTAPVPVITSPADNSIHSFGRIITFSGTASDEEDGDLPETNLSWSSDKDGIIGSGESFSTTELSVNTHIITLTATDNEGLKGRVSITVTIGNASPVALITSPANNSTHAFGKTITFSGTGTDVEDEELTENSLKWDSDIAGFLGYGEEIDIDNLAVGTHKITLTVTDSNGLIGSATITIIVGNASPVALITSPANNSTHAFGKTITFSGTGTDVEDEELTENSLKWDSDIAGFLGYGETLDIDSLAVGTHKITLTVTDSNGLIGSATITIIVGNASPVALITSPANNSTHAFGKT